MIPRPLTPEVFKEIYSKVPRLCVELVIMNKDGVLLTLRTLPTWNNMWHFPGGTVYYQETLKSAGERIAQEELGVKITIVKLLGYIEYPSEQKERGFGSSISFAFLAHIESGELRGSEEASDIRYFKELPPNMVEEQRDFIRENQHLLPSS